MLSLSKGLNSCACSKLIVKEAGHTKTCVTQVRLIIKWKFGILTKLMLAKKCVLQIFDLIHHIDIANLCVHTRVCAVYCYRSFPLPSPPRINFFDFYFWFFARLFSRDEILININRHHFSSASDPKSSSFPAVEIARLVCGASLIVLQLLCLFYFTKSTGEIALWY